MHLCPSFKTTSASSTRLVILGYGHAVFTIKYKHLKSYNWRNIYCNVYTLTLFSYLFSCAANAPSTIKTRPPFWYHFFIDFDIQTSSKAEFHLQFNSFIHSVHIHNHTKPCFKLQTVKKWSSFYNAYFWDCMLKTWEWLMFTNRFTITVTYVVFTIK
jgi:hypothetical protein